MSEDLTFEYNALLMEMHLLRAMNRSLQSQIRMMKTQQAHPARKDNNRDDR